MRKFGKWRYAFGSKGIFHRLYFLIAGVSPDHKLRYLYLKHFLNKFEKNYHIEKVLDAGCGSGDYSFYFSERYPSAKIVGIDYDDVRIHSNEVIIDKLGTQNLSFECCRIEDLTATKEYDFICCIDVLEHVENQDVAIEKLFNALKNNGLLYIHIPLKKEKRPIFDSYLNEFHKWSDEEHVADEDTRESFLEKIRRTGFKIDLERYTFNHFLGELAVSMTMVFFKPTTFNNVIRAVLFPVMSVLIYLDFLWGGRRGNALALLVSKAHN